MLKVPLGIKAMALALKHPNFGIFTAGNAISLIGTWMQRMAAGWLAWELTQSGAWLGLIAFADLFPTVLVTPLAGAAADSWNRLKVTKITQMLSLVQALAMALLVITGTINIWLLFWATLFLGAVAAFNQPARLALIPALVARSDLNAAVAVNSIIFNLARFIGPALAGVTIAVFGVGAAFAANAASFAVFLFALSRIRLTPSTFSGSRGGNMIGQFIDGFRYTASHPGITTILVLLMATALGARPVVELLPGFAAAVFESGPGGLAALTAAIGVGAIVGGLMIGGGADTESLLRMLIFSTLTLAIATILFTLTDIFWVGLATLMVAGFGLARTGIAAQTLIQLSVDESKRGRVLAIYGVIFRGGPALGALAMGVTSECFGLRASVFTGGLMVVAVWLLLTFSRRGRIAGSFDRLSARDQ